VEGRINLTTPSAEAGKGESDSETQDVVLVQAAIPTPDLDVPHDWGILLQIDPFSLRIRGMIGVLSSRLTGEPNMEASILGEKR